ALVLCLVGLVSQRRRLWPVGLALLGLVVMAMGPELQVNGNQTGIPLPYALLNNVPFVGASRQPLRFLATADACLALLAAFGFAGLKSKVQSLRRFAQVQSPKSKVQSHRQPSDFGLWTLDFGLVVLLALEVFEVPRATVGTGVGPAYAFLRDDRAAGAVLEVPSEIWSAPSLLDQTAHLRPIEGGY